MKPKEKADALLSKYMELFGRHDRGVSENPNVQFAWKHSKECATHTAEQILQTAFLEDGKMITEQEGFVSFWQQVIKEIEKR
jgi:hypothetical protein